MNERETHEFNVGDSVEWVYQGIKHSGVIAIVIPHGVAPASCIGNNTLRNKDAMNAHRDHESYLVRSTPRSTALFWPIVSLLRLIDRDRREERGNEHHDETVSDVIDGRKGSEA